MTIVGGNLADIAASAARLEEAGSHAVGAGELTSAATADLHRAVEQATADLLRRFDAVAAELQDQIRRSGGTLEASDWHGQAKQQALAIEAELSTSVHAVLADATGALQAEASAFRSRAEVLVGEIDGRFRSVMTRVDTEYARLARAADATRLNFEQADQTIRAV